MLIDAHTHFDSNLHSDMKKNRLDKAVLYFDAKTEYASVQGEKDLIFGMMFELNRLDWEERLQKAKEENVKIIKLLPYEHQILYKDFDEVCRFAKLVEEKDMMLSVCGAYGSKDLYNTNGVELAARILESGFKNPLIIAHGGMVRQLDTQVLMCEYPNLYYDISFSIKYWWGSHVIGDIYFTMASLDFERVFYGSDYPYVSFEDSMKYFRMFCDKYGLSQEQEDKILFKNFEAFSKLYLE